MHGKLPAIFAENVKNSYISIAWSRVVFQRIPGLPCIEAFANQREDSWRASKRTLLIQEHHLHLTKSIEKYKKLDVYP